MKLPYYVSVSGTYESGRLQVLTMPYIVMAASIDMAKAKAVERFTQSHSTIRFEEIQARALETIP